MTTDLQTRFLQAGAAMLLCNVAVAWRDDNWSAFLSIPSLVLAAYLAFSFGRQYGNDLVWWFFRTARRLRDARIYLLKIQFFIRWTLLGRFV